MSMKRRNGCIAFGALLLLSAWWIGSGSRWLHSILETKRFVGMSETPTAEQASELDAGTGKRGRNSVRDPAGKAKSLLNIRAGETGGFRVSPRSPGDGRALFGSDEIEGSLPGIPSLAGLVGKGAVMETFEHALQDGGKVLASVGDQTVTEYFLKDLYVKVEVVGSHGAFEELRMEVRSKNFKSSTQLTAQVGNAILFHLPEPDGGWVVVMRGKNEEGPTEEQQPTRE